MTKKPKPRHPSIHSVDTVRRSPVLLKKVGAADRFRHLLRLGHRLHDVPEGDDGQKLALLAGLCNAAGARRGRLTLLRMDSQTGMQQVVSTISYDTKSPPAGPSSARTLAADDDAGPCLDSFTPLVSVHLVARITLIRDRGDPRFAQADHALVDLIHAECGYIYEPDRARFGKSSSV